MLLNFFVILGVILLSGCATMQQSQPQVISDLQSRVSGLEGQLNDQDEQIKMLQQDLDTLDQKKVAMAPSVSPTVSNVPDTFTTKDVQRALKSAGFYDGPIDGKMGPKTKDAISSFQKSNGLKADGKVGPLTWTVLKKYAR